MTKSSTSRHNNKALFLLNHASVDEIDQIPGMTTKVAEAIHNYCQNQGVGDWEHLKRVPGVSQQRMTSIKDHFVRRAADELNSTEITQSDNKGENARLLKRLWNSPIFRVIGVISASLTVFIAIIEGLASWQGARDAIFGTPTPTPPRCYIQSDTGGLLVPVYKNGLDNYIGGWIGSIYPPSGIHFLLNGTEVHVLREIIGTTNSGWMAMGQTTVIRYEIEADYSARPRIVWVQPGSVAQLAGFESGDEILSVGDQDIEDMATLLDLVDKHRGSEIEIQVKRNLAPGQQVIIGITYDTEDQGLGILVEEVLVDGPSELAGIQVGDRILTIEGEQITKDNVKQILGKYNVGDEVNISVQRNQGSVSMRLLLAPSMSTTTLTVVPNEVPPDPQDLSLEVDSGPIRYGFVMQDNGVLGLFLDDAVNSPVRGFVDSSDVVCSTP